MATNESVTPVIRLQAERRGSMRIEVTASPQHFDHVALKMASSMARCDARLSFRKIIGGGEFVIESTSRDETEAAKDLGTIHASLLRQLGGAA